MFVVEIYAAVRRFVFIEGHSRREAARVFGLNRETVLKMCRFSLPPGYTRTKPPEKPKLGPLLPVIDAILEADRDAPPSSGTRPRGFSRGSGTSMGFSAATPWSRITCGSAGHEGAKPSCLCLIRRVTARWISGKRSR